VRRLITGLGLLLLVSAPPACLLYTDRINSAPVVAIVPPAALFRGKPAPFGATFSDPDGDQVSLRWMRVDRDCQKTVPGDWQAAAPVAMGENYSMVPGQSAFCLHLVATDSAGAEAVATYTGNPFNHEPVLQLTVVDPPPAEHYPLFTAFRLAAKAADADGDEVTVAWKIRDPAGKELTSSLCPPAEPGVAMACFAGEIPGALMVTATASDGGEKPTAATITLNVDEDQPACIEAADPSLDARTVVLAVTDPPRRFEVRQVRDDGNPFPPGPHGGPTFLWYTARETGVWKRAIGAFGPSFPVSAGTFDEDPRPGSVYRVRVEVRDPAHDSQPALRELEECHDERICQLAHCVRWAGWTVQLQ
jgi:hypothetical protein